MPSTRPSPMATEATGFISTLIGTNCEDDTISSASKKVDPWKYACDARTKCAAQLLESNCINLSKPAESATIRARLLPCPRCT